MSRLSDLFLIEKYSEMISKCEIHLKKIYIFFIVILKITFSTFRFDGTYFYLYFCFQIYSQFRRWRKDARNYFDKNRN